MVATKWEEGATEVPATKVHMTLDEELLEFVDRLAADERRTRSGMVQELIRRERDRMATPASTRDEIKNRAIAAVLSTDEPVSGEAEFSDVESYRRWRERLWSGTPRYGAPAS